MEDDEGEPPFWSRPGGSFRRSRRRGSSAAAIGSGVVMVLLLAAALVLVFIVVPSVLSAISRIFRPNVVKRSWDSLNLVLVLFAILCGLLSRNTVSEESSYGESRSFKSRASLKSNPSTPGDRWFGYSDQAAYGRPPSLNSLRSSSSYPDLRQEPMWAQANDRRRYFDDTNIYRPRRWRDDDEVGNGHGGSGYGGTAEIKTIQVDRLEVQEKKVSVSQTPLPELPPPRQSASPLKQALETSPPPPSSTSSTRPRAANRRSKRNKEALVETHALMHEPKTEDNRIIETYKVPPPPPPPPPPPDYDYYATPNKSDKNGKKRGGSGTRDFIRSLGRRRKKQRQKSVENFDSLLHKPQPCLPPPSQPPPPPPLPPPPSVFQNLFSSKRGKSKKDGPPPPPPPRLEAATSQPRPKPSAAAGRVGPANPVRLSDSVDPANTSPLIPIPPPPPPPFKVPDWKFSMRGGYVRIRSSSSSSASRGSSPDLMEERQTSPREEIVHVSDVDTNADNFISRFRAGLYVERMNSLKQRTRSKLGQDPNPGPDL